LNLQSAAFAKIALVYHYFAKLTTNPTHIVINDLAKNMD
jgi:hypothetical protein